MKTSEMKELIERATKGPWTKSFAGEPIEINGHEAHSCDRISAETWTGLCFVFKSGDYIDDEEGKANAALIALAPDLAAEVIALRELLERARIALTFYGNEMTRDNPGKSKIYPFGITIENDIRAALTDTEG